MTRNYPRESYVDNFLNRALKEINTVVFELLRNEFSHHPLRQNFRKTINDRRPNYPKKVSGPRKK